MKKILIAAMIVSILINFVVFFLCFDDMQPLGMLMTAGNILICAKIISDIWRNSDDARRQG